MSGRAAEAKRLLDALAVAPRAAGSEDEQRAFELCSSFLMEHGFRVRREEFSFSAFPGAFATPLAGVATGAMFVTVCTWAASTRLQSVWLIVIAHAVVMLAVAWLGTRRGVLHIPFMRRTAANLVAQLGAAEPRVWLMAHLDSKSQPVSIIVRATGVLLCVAMYYALMALLLLSTLGFTWITIICVVAALGSVGSLALALSVVTNRSHGALDNASGVVAALIAAQSLALAGESGVGVVLTSGEELGLAGAHAWGEGRQPGVALNCDSVDDDGDFLCIVGRGAGGRAHQAIKKACVARETRWRETRMLVGILVDSVALGSRGWDSVTLCRGTRASLTRIHTASDTSVRLRGDGIVKAADVLGLAARIVLNPHGGA